MAVKPAQIGQLQRKRLYRQSVRLEAGQSPESRVVYLKAPKREAAFADQARLRQQGGQFWPNVFCTGGSQGSSDLCTLGMNKPDSSHA